MKSQTVNSQIVKSRFVPILLLASLVVPAAAQLPPPPTAVAPPAVGSPAAIRPAVTVPTPNYQIAAGDVIGVSVINFPNLSAPQVMVAPDGTVSLPLLDPTLVAGLTQEDATRLLIAKWKKFVFKPAVTVSLIQKHIQTVVLNGSLNRTGTLDYRPNLHLLEALAQMGGALITADPTQAVLTHADGSKQPLDLSHPETKSDDPNINVVLQPGDVLYVPEQQGKISVVGQVKNPGNLYYREKLTVLDAINSSGGPIDDTADLNDATLTHNGKTTKLDLDALLKKGDLTANADLAPGDIVTIPELHNRVYVYGDVQRQGFYYYKPGDRIQDAFAPAGLAPDADTGKVNFIHVSSDKKVAHMEVINFEKFLHKGDITGNPEVRPGDALYIPRKAHTLSLNDIIAPLSAVGSVAQTTRFLQGR